MNERQQFTFYRSFWEAAKILPPKEKTLVLEAICAYALDDEERELSLVSGAIFALIKPNLDASKRKAEGGKKGRPAKDNGKIDERCGEDNGNEKEEENECYIYSSQVTNEISSFASDSKPYRCAVYLDDRIRERFPSKPKSSEATLQKWADAFDKLNRIDKQSWADISDTLAWSQDDSFWSKNIMSGDKFRKQFFQLFAKAREA